jgi:hypothetical protein
MMMMVMKEMMMIATHKQEQTDLLGTSPQKLPDGPSVMCHSHHYPNCYAILHQTVTVVGPVVAKVSAHDDGD